MVKDGEDYHRLQTTNLKDLARMNFEDGQTLSESFKGQVNQNLYIFSSGFTRKLLQKVFFLSLEKE